MIQNEFIFYSVYDTERLHRLKPVYIRQKSIYDKKRTVICDTERTFTIHLFMIQNDCIGHSTCEIHKEYLRYMSVDDLEKIHTIQLYMIQNNCIRYNTCEMHKEWIRYMNVYDTEKITYISTKLYGISAYDTAIVYIIKRAQCANITLGRVT